MNFCNEELLVTNHKIIIFNWKLSKHEIENSNIQVHKKQTFYATPLAGKVMLMMFWRHERIILEHYMPQKSAVNSDTYCDLL